MAFEKFVTALLPPLVYYALIKSVRGHHLRWIVQLKTYHNMGLALFSGWVCHRALRNVYLEGRIRPFDMMCRTPQTPDWTMWTAWYISKIWEWGDTLFIIEAGKPVLPLHMYHHMSTAALVAIQTWNRDVYTPMADVGTIMNAAVHTIMYTYYLAPRRLCKIRRLLTSLQIGQHWAMVVGLGALLLGRRTHALQECDIPLFNYVASFGVYAMYLTQFMRFYWSTYLLPKPGEGTRVDRRLGKNV